MKLIPNDGPLEKLAVCLIALLAVVLLGLVRDVVPEEHQGMVDVVESSVAPGFRGLVNGFVTQEEAP